MTVACAIPCQGLVYLCCDYRTMLYSFEQSVMYYQSQHLLGRCVCYTCPLCCLHWRCRYSPRQVTPWQDQAALTRFSLWCRISLFPARILSLLLSKKVDRPNSILAILRAWGWAMLPSKMPQKICGQKTLCKESAMRRQVHPESMHRSSDLAVKAASHQSSNLSCGQDDLIPEAHARTP